jgi:hypothetical protein
MVPFHHKRVEFFQLTVQPLEAITTQLGAQTVASELHNITALSTSAVLLSHHISVTHVHSAVFLDHHKIIVDSYHKFVFSCPQIIDASSG